MDLEVVQAKGQHMKLIYSEKLALQLHKSQ
jgi:hypothetical protein